MKCELIEMRASYGNIWVKSIFGKGTANAELESGELASPNLLQAFGGGKKFLGSVQESWVCTIDSQSLGHAVQWKVMRMRCCSSSLVPSFT